MEGHHDLHSFERSPDIKGIKTLIRLSVNGNLGFERSPDIKGIKTNTHKAYQHTALHLNVALISKGLRLPLVFPPFEQARFERSPDIKGIKT